MDIYSLPLPPTTPKVVTHTHAHTPIVQLSVIYSRALMGYSMWRPRLCYRIRLYLMCSSSKGLQGEATEIACGEREGRLCLMMQVQLRNNSLEKRKSLCNK